jgi:hypothetical protein
MQYRQKYIYICTSVSLGLSVTGFVSVFCVICNVDRMFSDRQKSVYNKCRPT